MTTPYFVPGAYAPLSPFKVKTTTTMETLVFPVHTKVLQYLAANGGAFVGYYDPATGNMDAIAVDPNKVDISLGTVKLDTDKAGTFTVVSEAFKNHLPIVTHWDQTLNNGDGGQSFGGIDGINEITLDSNFNVQRNDDLLDFTTDQHTYNVNNYALFTPNATAPGFERYVGENYSTLKITDIYAMYMSHLILQRTGYPLLFRNHTALDSTTPIVAVEENVPAFQAVNGVEITGHLDATKSSLATFLLPPNWQKQPTEPYPILMNSLYDLNESFAMLEKKGLTYISIISALLLTGPVVGILYNGGGSTGTRSMNPSFHENLAKLFQVAKDKVGADPHRIVIEGASRGGLSALECAINQDGSDYTVRYCVATVPAVQYGEHLAYFNDNSYPGLYLARYMDVGYKKSWQSGWLDPETGLSNRGKHLAVMAGSIDPDHVDLMSPMSNANVWKLRERGTNVILKIGTNDAYIPLAHTIKYFNKLKENGVPVHLDITYRGGHGYSFLDPETELKKLLTNVINKNYAPVSGVRHLKRAPQFDYISTVQCDDFTPVHAPVTLEAPELIVSNSTVEFTVSGGTNDQYYLMLHKLDDTALASGQIKTESSRLLVSGSFPANGTKELHATVHRVVMSQAEYPEGYYLYALYYSKDGGKTLIQCPQENIPRPPALQNIHAPIMKIEAAERDLTGLEMYNLLAQHAFGWGVSSV